MPASIEPDPFLHVEARLARDGDFRFAAPIEVTCVHEVKGLEFDYVIVPDATAQSYPEEATARRALYVAVTRTAQQLLVVGTGSWTPLLSHDIGRTGSPSYGRRGGV